LSDVIREVMRSFPLGVAVVTTTWNGKSVGMTVNTFNSLSLNPPLVMFAADVTKGNDKPFRESKGFIVNLTDDEETLKTFAFSPVEERFKLVEYREVEGMPLLSKAYAYVVAARREVLEIGDHAIIVGEVKFGERMRDPTPLVYYMRDFRRLC